MSLYQSNTAASSSSHANPRRRRQATACTSCRDRRVRCDRTRPACLQCSKRHQVCEYINTPPPAIEFVTEAPGLSSPIVPSETWKSVFESQRALVDRANVHEEKVQEGALWALAESRPFNQPSQAGSLRASLDPAIPIGSLGESFLSSLFSCLAPKETYLPYFENFLLSVHPLVPLYPVATLRQIYIEFWDNLSLNTSAELLVFILATLYTGAANLASSRDNKDSVIIHEMYGKLIIALDLSSYYVISSASSLRLLHGIIIMNTFRASQLPPYTAFGFLPFAIRFAQSMRLHIHQGSESSLDSESRRRIWWHLVFMDIESTIASGLQGIIRPNGQTIQPPALNNSFLGEEDIPRTPAAFAMQGHWELAHRMHTWLERKPEQHEIVHFGRIIENLLNLIPDCDGSEWARVYLTMLVDRAYCMIGLRFWQLDQFKGTGCHSEVVRTSRSFLKKYLRLAELSRDLGFSWFIPGLIQPIHALMILLMHLSGCAKPDDESKLSQDLINQVISLRVSLLPNGASAHLASNDKFTTIRLNNPRYRMLSSMRMDVFKKFKWPVVIEPSLNDPQVEDSGAEQPNGTGYSQVGLAADISFGNQIIWDDWDPIASSVPSETPSWDDWGSLMPDFFTEDSHS